MSLQQLKIVPSNLYGPHVLLCMPDNIEQDGVLGNSSQIWTRALLSSWIV